MLVPAQTLQMHQLPKFAAECVMQVCMYMSHSSFVTADVRQGYITNQQLHLGTLLTRAASYLQEPMAFLDIQGFENVCDVLHIRVCICFFWGMPAAAAQVHCWLLAHKH